MTGGQAGTRGAARLLMVCALLLGLFLMHGSPASAAEGCHGVVSPSPAMAGHDHAAFNQAVPTAGHGRAALAALTPTSGAQCVSTPAPERITVPTPGLVAIAALSALAAALLGRMRAAGGRIGRRGPPDGGRDLLLRACIART
ncbi:hypothetical protein ABZT34_39175 [Streptomyces sp. NPDC005329]|uniref:hypothetical protein n=1 Tax=Streptomyces sp. NPDC005329 TaxID=3157034 RepID=UPI0033BF87F3